MKSWDLTQITVPSKANVELTHNNRRKEDLIMVIMWLVDNCTHLSIILKWYANKVALFFTPWVIIWLLLVQLFLNYTQMCVCTHVYVHVCMHACMCDWLPIQNFKNMLVKPFLSSQYFISNCNYNGEFYS